MMWLPDSTHSEAVLGVGNIGFCLGPRAFRGLAQTYALRYNRNCSRKGKNFNFRILNKKSIIKLTEIPEFHFTVFYLNKKSLFYCIFGLPWLKPVLHDTWSCTRSRILAGIMVRKYRVIRALHYTSPASSRLPRASHNLKPPLHPLFISATSVRQRDYEYNLQLCQPSHLQWYRYAKRHSSPSCFLLGTHLPVPHSTFSCFTFIFVLPHHIRRYAFSSWCIVTK
jgi:hypothetical protein